MNSTSYATVWVRSTRIMRLSSTTYSITGVARPKSSLLQRHWLVTTSRSRHYIGAPDGHSRYQGHDRRNPFGRAVPNFSPAVMSGLHLVESPLSTRTTN